jgi:hypothetical protein
MNSTTGGAAGARDLRVAECVFEPGADWRARLAEGGATATLADALSDTLRTVYARLGVPGNARVTVPSAPDQPTTTLRARLDSRPLRVPAAFAAEVASLTDADPVRASCLLLRAAVELRPGTLLDDTRTRALAATLGGTVRDDTAVILRALVEQGVSLADTVALEAGLAAADRLGADTDEAVEVIGSRLRGDTIDVELHPVDAAALGAPPDERPVAWRDVAQLQLHEDGLRTLLRSNVGLAAPPLRVVAREDLPPGMIAVRINAVRGVPRRGLPLDARLANATPDYLAQLGIPCAPIPHPVSGVICGAVAAEAEPALGEAGILNWDAASFVALVAIAEIAARAWQVFDLADMERELAAIRTTVPVTVDAVLTRTSIPRLTAIVRSLLRSRAPVTDLPGILDHVAAYEYVLAPLDGKIPFSGPLALDPGVARPPYDRPQYVARYLRKRMARILSHRTAGAGNALDLLLLEPDDEAELAARLGTDAPEPPRFDDVADALEEVLARGRGGTVTPHILTDARIARDLGDWLAPEFPRVSVFSFDDLAPTTSLQLVARLELTRG